MKASKKTDYPSVQIGSSLMLVVFMVLCLTAFATLSLSSALRGYNYSQKTASKTLDYYKAEEAANYKLSQITDILKSTAEDSSGEYLQQALTQLQTIEGVTIDSNQYICYDVPVNEQQRLAVKLLLYDTVSPDRGYYKIVSWTEVPSSQWNSDSTLPVIGS